MYCSTGELCYMFCNILVIVIHIVLLSVVVGKWEGSVRLVAKLCIFLPSKAGPDRTQTSVELEYEPCELDIPGV